MNDTGPDATPIVDRTTSFVGRNLENGLPYIYRIEAVGAGGVSASYATAPKLLAIAT